MSAARAATVAQDANVRSISVSDTACQVLNNQSANAAVTKIAAIEVRDTAANITASYASLASFAGITRMSLTDNDNITLSATQLRNTAGLLAKIAGNYKLTVTGVAAGDVAATGRMRTVDTIHVSDTVGNAVANHQALRGSKVAEVRLSGAVQSARIDRLDELGDKLISVTNAGTGITTGYDQHVQRSAGQADGRLLQRRRRAGLGGLGACR